MYTLDQIRQPIEKEMQQFENLFKLQMQSKVPLLNTIVQYLYRTKGKQLRPMFVFHSAKMLGNTSDSTYTAAILIELLHTATLVHDDVVDDSNERRGFFSVYALWKSKIAVLLGDYLLAKGLLTAVESKRYDLLEIVSDAVKQMSEGEILQLKHARKFDITEEKYFDIIEKKTASLISSCCACGALSVTNNPEHIETLKLFGKYVGIAFQIKDDLLDLTPRGITGKPAGNDLKEKKFTLPLIHALNTCSKEERRKMISLVKKNKTNSANINKLIDFINRQQGLAYANDKMNHYKILAMDLLNSFQDNEYKNSLKELVNFTIARNK
jgi:octaprenyl-diphosphate synthase